MSVGTSELTADQVMRDHAASQWLKSALRTALERDPVDALNDALALAGILEDRVRQLFELNDID